MVFIYFPQICTFLALCPAGPSTDLTLGWGPWAAPAAAGRTLQGPADFLLGRADFLLWPADFLLDPAESLLQTFLMANTIYTHNFKGV